MLTVADSNVKAVPSGYAPFWAPFLHIQVPGPCEKPSTLKFWPSVWHLLTDDGDRAVSRHISVPSHRSSRCVRSGAGTQQSFRSTSFSISDAEILLAHPARCVFLSHFRLGFYSLLVDYRAKIGMTNGSFYPDCETQDQTVRCWGGTGPFLYLLLLSIISPTDFADTATRVCSDAWSAVNNTTKNMIVYNVTLPFSAMVCTFIVT